MEDTMIKEIVRDQEELSQISDGINIKDDINEINEILSELRKAMDKYNLDALSAPQIGYKKRIFSIRDSKGIHGFINPFVLKESGLKLNREKDISIVNKKGEPIEYLYPRYDKIILNCQVPYDIKTKSPAQERLTLVGYWACVYQQMIDHLNGALISDIGLELDEEWDKASEEEKDEVVKMYLEALQNLDKDIKANIEENEELSKQMKAIQFQSDMLTGKIEVEQEEIDEKTSKKITANIKKAKKENSEE